MFARLGIFGVGLIGGSIAKAARLNQLANTIIGYGREQDLVNLKLAKQLGVIDEYFINDAIIADLKNHSQSNDCIIIATPVASIESILQLLKPVWSDNSIYSDVGSTKVNIIEAAQRVFGTVPTNLVPAHPIAGAENSGVQAALNDLFVNRRLIITPTNNTNPQAVAIIKQFWQQLGSSIFEMSAQHHDSILAATSHLPHLLAFALVDMLGHKNEQSDILKYAAGGFKDFTRIASSDPTMWTAICSANKTEIIPLLEQYKNELTKLQSLLSSDNSDELFALFNYAKQTRQHFLEQFDKPKE
jgi:prephenate dehydrogenase